MYVPLVLRTLPCLAYDIESSTLKTQHHAPSLFFFLPFSSPCACALLPWFSVILWIGGRVSDQLHGSINACQVVPDNDLPYSIFSVGTQMQGRGKARYAGARWTRYEAVGACPPVFSLLFPFGTIHAQKQKERSQCLHALVPTVQDERELQEPLDGGGSYELLASLLVLVLMLMLMPMPAQY